jgi:hypothetical protein
MKTFYVNTVYRKKAICSYSQTICVYPKSFREPCGQKAAGITINVTVKNISTDVKGLSV